jgi:hypothetical protein
MNDDDVPESNIGPSPEVAAFEARIALTLTARADVLVIEDRPFRIDEPAGARRSVPTGTADPDDGAIIELDLAARPEVSPELHGSRPSVRRRAVVWVAGIAAAVVLVVAVAAITGNRPDVATYTGGGDGLAGQPVFLPAWVPDGLVLQDLTVRPPFGDPPSPAHRQLLSSTTGEAAVLLHIEIDRPSFVPLGTELSARGTTVGVRPSTETLGAVPLTELRWSEGDVDVSATTRDLTETDAASLVDALTWADPADPLAGFVPPDGWISLVEPTTGLGIGTGTELTYVDPSNPSQVALTVRAMAPADVAPGYLLSSMVGHVGDDGVAVAIQSGTGVGAPSMTYATWPDGRHAVVRGDGIDAGTTERIARSVRPSSGMEIATLGADLSQRLGTGEVLAAADLPAGRVELVGSPKPAAVCLTIDGIRTCRSVLREMSSFASGFVAGSTAIGPTWYLFGAARDGIHITDDESSDRMFPVLRTGEPIDPNLPVKTSAPYATDGEWYLSVLAVRADADQAYVTGGGTITVGRTLI